MATVACIWHFQENQNLLCPFWGHSGAPWISVFWQSELWQDVACEQQLFKPIVHVGTNSHVEIEIEICGEETARNKKTGGRHLCCLERSALLCREWSGFSQKCGPVVVGRWCTWRFKNNPSCGAESSRSWKLGARWERGQRRKERDERKEGETQLHREIEWGGEHRRDREGDKKRREDLNIKGSRCFPYEGYYELNPTTHTLNHVPIVI